MPEHHCWGILKKNHKTHEKHVFNKYISLFRDLSYIRSFFQHFISHFLYTFYCIRIYRPPPS